MIVGTPTNRRIVTSVGKPSDGVSGESKPTPKMSNATTFATARNRLRQIGVSTVEVNIWLTFEFCDWKKAQLFASPLE